MSGEIQTSELTGILYVDDEPLLTQMFQESLSRKGFKVFSANSGLAALSVMREHAGDIAVVVTDITMPDMDGIDLARRLFLIAPHVPVLLITGLQVSSVPPGCPENVAGTLEKPIRPKAVAERLREMLSQSKQ